MIEDVFEFAKLVPQMKAIAGLDLGTKTIGVALSDRLHTIASPSHVIAKSKFGKDAAQLWEFISKEEIGGLVLGLPQNLNGTNGPRVQATKGFAYNLAKLWGEKCPPILLWDERLTTVEAERALLEADMSRAKRAKKIDAVAASLILQGTLDRMEVIRRGV